MAVTAYIKISPYSMFSMQNNKNNIFANKVKQ